MHRFIFAYVFDETGVCAHEKGSVKDGSLDLAQNSTTAEPAVTQSEYTTVVPQPANGEVNHCDDDATTGDYFARVDTASLSVAPTDTSLNTTDIRTNAEAYTGEDPLLAFNAGAWLHIQMRST
jgi:hypothetical protein